MGLFGEKAVAPGQGGIFPQSQALPPLQSFPLSEGKQKSAAFEHFFSLFWPLDAPQNLVPPRDCKRA